MTHVMKIDEFLNERLDIQPISKERLGGNQKVNKYTFDYEGNTVTFNGENLTEAVFYLNDCRITVSKKGKFDGNSRYFGYDGITYEDVDIEVSDGVAIFNGCEKAYHYDNTPAQNHLNDKLVITFPKLKDILTDAEEFKRAISYILELSDGDLLAYFNGGDENETLPSSAEMNIVALFEGYFFNYLSTEYTKIEPYTK